MRIRKSLARLVVALCLMIAGCLAAAVGPAAAEGPNAVQPLAGCATNTLAANDDGSTGAVPLPFVLDFYGNEYSSLFVNNNGNVTFDEPLSQFTPFDFTISGVPMIAPFLADVDTRGAGSGLVTYGNVTVGGRTAFCVNWVDVGYFAAQRGQEEQLSAAVDPRGHGG